PEVVQPYARRSQRLAEAIALLGFVLGGEAGARTAKQRGILTRPDTLLRAIRRTPLEPPQTPRVLGIDDWAIRRGQRYGTVLIDLERRCRVDVLPDRTAETLTAWLQVHPGIEIISRDRASAYAEAARLGAPQAVQIADRWHLLKNLGEALERFFAAHHQDLSQIAGSLTIAARQAAMQQARRPSGAASASATPEGEDSGPTTQR